MSATDMSAHLGKHVLRSVLAVFAAMIAGSAVMFAVQWGNYLLFPPPSGFDYNNPDDLKEIVAAMPLAALLILELSYALGSIVAGMVVGRVAILRALLHALAVGLIFTLLGFVNLSEFPAPMWLAVLTTVTYVPATLLGAWIARRGSSQPPPPQEIA